MSSARQSDAKGQIPSKPVHETTVIGGSGSSAPNKKAELVAVLAADSQQGSAVAMTLMEGGYKVRATVKDVKSDAAQSLQRQGADVTVAGLDDEGSMRQLLSGAFAVWALTGLWEPAEGPMGAAGSKAGQQLVKVAKEEGLTTFMLPALPRSWDKATAKQPIWTAALEAGFTTCVAVVVGFYYSNFETLSSDLPISSTKGGKLTFHLPLKASDKLPGCDATDLGSVALAILANPQRFDKKLVGFTSTYNKPVSDWLEAVHKISGKEVSLETTSGQSAVAEALGEAEKHGYYSSDAGELVDAQSICEDPLATFEQWLVKAGWKTKFDETLAAKIKQLEV